MRDRIKELRRVPASELRANPKNWRRHPPAQEAALRGVLEDIGFADAVIARETEDGLELIDGHLRQEVMGNQVIPVLIVDVTEEEADKMLLTYDPLAAMAEVDQDQLLNLFQSTQFAISPLSGNCMMFMSDRAYCSRTGRLTICWRHWLTGSGCRNLAT